jgi:Cyanobacterial TRADD-N associated 2-Transmembrane domain
MNIMAIRAEGRATSSQIPFGAKANKQGEKHLILSLIHNKMKTPLDHIDHADVTKIQCVAAASLELNEKYHKRILRQASLSFGFAAFTAFSGFMLFFFAVIYLMQHLTQFVLITALGGAITTVLSGTSFYLYRHTLKYFNDIHQCLARTELILLGNSLCMQIHDLDKRNEAYMELIKNVTQLTILIGEGEQKQNQQN